MYTRENRHFGDIPAKYSYFTDLGLAVAEIARREHLENAARNEACAVLAMLGVKPGDWEEE